MPHRIIIFLVIPPAHLWLGVQNESGRGMNVWKALSLLNVSSNTLPTRVQHNDDGECVTAGILLYMDRESKVEVLSCCRKCEWELGGKLFHLEFL